MTESTGRSPGSKTNVTPDAPAEPAPPETTLPEAGTEPTTVVPTTGTLAVLSEPVVPNTDPLPALAPDQQPETAGEGRALLALTPNAPLSRQFETFPAIIEGALSAVLDGTIPSDEFFDAIALQTPDGIVVSPYLVCPIGLGESCRADPTDYVAYLSECVWPGIEVFTAWVESEGAWAAAAVCVWVPTADEIAAASERLAAMISPKVEAHGGPTVRDTGFDPFASELATAWAGDIKLGEDTSQPQLDAARDRLAAQGLVTWYHFWVISPLTPDSPRASTRIDEAWYGWDLSDWGVLHLGVGATVRHGQFVAFAVLAI